jgi:hypothetical protein
MLREVLLGARQSTSCLSRNISTALQPVVTSVVVAETEGVGVRNVKVATAGISTKAYVNVSIQNWHTWEAVIGPVTGITGVNVAVLVGVNIAVEVLVTSIVAVKVGWVVAVGDTCCPAQAVVRSTKVSELNKKTRANFFNSSSPYH